MKKKATIMKNCSTSSKILKYQKNSFGNIFKIVFENQQILACWCTEMATIKWLKNEEKSYNYEKLNTSRELRC